MKFSIFPSSSKPWFIPCPKHIFVSCTGEVSGASWQHVLGWDGGGRGREGRDQEEVSQSLREKEERRVQQVMLLLLFMIAEINKSKYYSIELG